MMTARLPFRASDPAKDPSKRAAQLLGVAALIVLALFLARAPLTWVAAAMIASALGIGLLLDPALGLIALALTIPYNQLVHMPIGVAGAGLVEALLLATIAAWMGWSVVARREGAVTAGGGWRLSLLDGMLLVFLWIALASLTQATSWREGLPEWIKWAEFAAVYLLGARILRPRSVCWVLAALLLAGFSQALLGAYQFLTQSGPEAFVLPGGFMRAYGTFQQPNPYAGYLGFLAPVAASLALGAAGEWWRGRRARHLVLAGLLAAVTSALIAGILMSWSRGAWLGLGAALVAVAGFRSRKTAAITAIALVVVVVAVYLFGAGWLPGPLQARVADLGGYVSGPDPSRTEIDDANFSVLERLAHWEAGLRMFADHPWLGVGIGNYGIAYAAYALPHWYQALGHAHNIFINFFAETGVLGGIAFLLVWVGIALTAVRRIRYGGVTAALATGILGTWVYLSVHNLFDNLFVQHMQLQLALLLATLVALTRAGNAASNPGTKTTEGHPRLMAYPTTYSMSYELPPFLAWLVRLPVVNRLGLERRPRELVRFIKFAAVGAFGAIVDLTILNIMHKVFGLPLLVANTISVSIAIVSNFVWNRYWTFPESRERPVGEQLTKFTIVNVIGLGINNLVLWILTHIMANFVPDPWNYNIAKLGAIGVVLFWNFFVNRIWTYRGIE